MTFPEEVQEKIDRLFAELGQKNVSREREKLSKNYHNKGGKGEILIENIDMSKAYAISRMPATFSVISSLIDDLIKQDLIDRNKIKSIFDLGSGTGAGYFALKAIFDESQIKLFERDKNMISLFNILSENKQKVEICDIVADEISGNADLVLSSYVFNEIDSGEKNKLFEKMLSLSNDYVLIIDAGTEKNYRSLMELKGQASKFGYNVLAPCLCSECPINQGDYCDFSVRVQRSASMKKAKNASESYEDERFVYLLLSKTKTRPKGIRRIIARPVIMKGNVSLKLCEEDGVKTERFAKSNGEIYKRAKKLKTNDLIYN